MKGVLSDLKQWIVFGTIFIFPFFFFPVTSEFIVTSKLYLMSVAALVLLVVSTIEFLVTKKLDMKKKPYDLGLFLLLIAMTVSVLLSSPNKIQAIFNVNFGLLSVWVLFVLYFYASRMENKRQEMLRIFEVVSFFLAALTIILFFQPFRFFPLPPSLSYLNNSFFTPAGTQLDLAILLGFFLILEGVAMVRKIATASWRDFVVPFVVFIAFSLTLLRVIKPLLTNQQTTLILPPFRISWYAAVEILKNPVSAFFGVGVDNFSSVFTKVKDFTYIQSNLWQINSFSVARSVPLHILTETGIFGLFAFAMLIFILIKNVIKKKVADPSIEFTAAAIYLIVVVFLFPPTLPLLFLLLIFLAIQSPESGTSPSTLDLSNFMPLIIIAAVTSFVVVAVLSYCIGRSYVAEYLFKQSLDGYLKNDIKQLYDDQKQVVVINPYFEKYRINFSQTNILIANNVAAKVSSGGAQLSEQDRQIIAQAIQAAIAEAKAAVTLNPQKAQNWENLAVIYRNILSVAQNADTWTVSSYQRAIVLDPQNPNYRLNLGGVYYQLGNYDEAIKQFEQTIVLKPNWANAHYNLAWASYQKKDYQRAATEMQNALSLLNVSQDSADYQRAKKELEQFKNKLPVDQNLPQPLQATP